MYIGERQFAINSGLRFSYNNNDGNYVYQIGASVGCLFKLKDKKGGYNNKFFLNGNYNLIRSEDQDFNNNWFIHIRYNKELTEIFRIEAFVQSQENQLLSISSRNLAGTGIRLKVLEAMKKRSLHTYIGLAYMYEREKSENFNVDFKNHRMSSYLAATLDFGEDKPKIINTLYYQPLFEDFDNFRLSEEFSAEFPFSETFSFSVIFNYFLNNQTPAGDAEYTSSLVFGFNYNFKSKLDKPDLRF